MTMVNEWLLKSFLSQEHCDDRKKGLLILPKTAEKYRNFTNGSRGSSIHHKIKISGAQTTMIF